MNYVLFNKATGAIVQSGTCPPSALPRLAAARPGHDAIEATGNDLEHEVKGGKLQLRPAGQIAARKAAYMAAGEPPKGSKSKIERVLAFLKKKGLDLGPDGADL